MENLLFMLVNNKIKPKLNLGLLLLGIISLAFILRWWHFTSNPPGLYVDEVSHGYNAYSILKTGKDEYGIFLPFFIRSFDIYNPPLATYTLVPSIAIFGLNEIAVRFPAVLFGTLFIPLTYFLVAFLTKNKKLALISAFFSAISPWHIHFSRFYHEQNLTVFFSTLGVTLFLFAQKKPYLYILSAISYTIAINFSHVGKVFVPLLILGSFIFLRPKIQKNLIYIVTAIVIVVLGMTPHVLNTRESLHRASSVSIFTSDVGNKKDKFLDGYLSHFSPLFLFIRGDYQGRHSVPGMGELYVFEIPLTLFGLYLLIKIKEKSYKFLLFWLLIAPIPAALSIPTPHAGRDLVTMPVWSIVSALGLIFILKNFRWLWITPLIFIGFYNFLTYIHLYHSHYPKEKGPDWSDGYKELAQYLGQNYDNYERFAVTRYWGQLYIYILFFTKFDPAQYHAQSENKLAFDKYEFYLGAPDQSDKKTLFVSIGDKRENIKKLIKRNNGDLVFVVHE